MNNKKDIWTLLKKEFLQDREAWAEPVPLNEIKDAERELNVKFDESYTQFVNKYGAGEVGSFFIYGLRKISMMGSFCTTVIENTLRYRSQQYPGTENWYIVSDDFSGNPFGVDPKGKVWLSDHDTGEIVAVAEDFEEFLYKLYTDTLWEDD